jgi:hypothetical protein
MKKKKIYEQPHTAVTKVELESPICSGSVKMEADAPNNNQETGTEAQVVNTDFESYNTATADTKWE